MDRCLRRQSARFKSEESEAPEDLFELDDTKFPVFPLHDDLVDASDQMSPESLVKTEDDGNTPRPEAQDSKRQSIGRPLRRAAEKVQSYKERPINIKLRRPG